MSFAIRMGVPEMEALWNALHKAALSDTLKGPDKALYKKLCKAIRLLANDPRHPGLNSHEIEPLSKRYGIKVWQSYLENHTPAAGRLFWVYGSGKNEITIIGLEPHPEDRKGGYEKVRLSSLGKIEK